MNQTRENPILQASNEIDSLRLGVDKDEVRLTDSDDVRATAVALASQARRTLLLHTFDLEARIYDRQPFIEAVSALVRRHPGACFDVQVH